jgi:hypothetical protein
VILAVRRPEVQKITGEVKTRVVAPKPRNAEDDVVADGPDMEGNVFVVGPDDESGVQEMADVAVFERRAIDGLCRPAYGKAADRKRMLTSKRIADHVELTARIDQRNGWKTFVFVEVEFEGDAHRALFGLGR